MAFSNDDRTRIIQALQQKGVASTCPRCSHSEWVLGETYTTLPLQELRGAIVLGGPSIPAIVLVCKHCGHIEMHSSKVLAGLPVEGNNGR